MYILFTYLVEFWPLILMEEWLFKFVCMERTLIYVFAAQAGTYIKEFIHGDLGRTQPRYNLFNHLDLERLGFCLSSWSLERLGFGTLEIPSFDWLGTLLFMFCWSEWLPFVFCSIGSILTCRAEILRLDVTDVKMECFLTEWGYCLFLHSFVLFSSVRLENWVPLAGTITLYNYSAEAAALGDSYTVQTKWCSRSISESLECSCFCFPEVLIYWPVLRFHVFYVDFYLKIQVHFPFAWCKITIGPVSPFIHWIN